MKTAVALGSFDGIHIAHQKVLDLPKGYRKVVLTFEKPPKMYFDCRQELIMTFSDKALVLENMGFSSVVDLDFEKIRNTEPYDFLESIYKTYNPAVISCGFNYRFGKNGGGDTSLLREFCKEKQIELRICEEVTTDGTLVSSSFIRNLLKSGQIAKANSLMKIPFSFEGEVIKGDARGRTLGFPTINQKYPTELVTVKFGVYKSEVIIDDEPYDAITNIGVRPTFGSDYVISETFIKKFAGDLYGKSVRVVLKEFLRDEKKFASKEELVKQIEKDILN